VSAPTSTSMAMLSTVTDYGSIDLPRAAARLRTDRRSLVLASTSMLLVLAAVAVSVNVRLGPWSPRVIELALDHSACENDPAPEVRKRCS